MEVLIFIVGAAGYAGVEYLYRGVHSLDDGADGRCLPACLLLLYKRNKGYSAARSGSCRSMHRDSVRVLCGRCSQSLVRMACVGLLPGTGKSAGADLPVVFLYMVSAVPHHPHAFFCFRFMV